MFRTPEVFQAAKDRRPAGGRTLPSTAVARPRRDARAAGAHHQARVQPSRCTRSDSGPRPRYVFAIYWVGGQRHWVGANYYQVGGHRY